MTNFAVLVEEVLDEDAAGLLACQRRSRELAAQVRELLAQSVRSAYGAQDGFLNSSFAHAADILDSAADRLKEKARQQALSSPNQAFGIAKDYVSRKADKLRANVVKRLTPTISVQFGSK